MRAVAVVLASSLAGWLAGSLAGSLAGWRRKKTLHGLLCLKILK